MKRRKTFLFVSTASLLLALAGCSEPPTSAPWASAGALAQARSHHSATPLSDGSVLIAGGSGASTALASAELWNAATGRWVLAKNMQAARFHHAGVRIADDRILLLGGTNGGVLASVEAYDSATREFSNVAPMKDARSQLAAVHLPSFDEVLVMGGRGSSGPLSSVEVYDPPTNTWSAKKNLFIARAEHTATLIPVSIPQENAEAVQQPFVLVIGGVDASETATGTAELYDAKINQWTSVTNDMAEARRGHTATQFRDPSAIKFPEQSILVVGGLDKSGVALSSAERYHCSWDEMTAPPMATATCARKSAASLHHARYGHTATLLSDGRVLIVGGQDEKGPLDSVEMYDAKNDMFVEVEPLSSLRTDHTATWLADGSVLVVGGRASGELSSTERFVPDDPRIPCARTTDCPEAMVCNAELRCEQTAWPLSSESACSYAAGDTPAGRGTFGTAFAIMLLAWGMRRKGAPHPPIPPLQLRFASRRGGSRKIRNGLAASFIGSFALLAPSIAQAQTSTFFLDRLQIAGGSQDGTAVWRPVFGRTGVFGQFALGYARDPLHVSTFVHDGTRARALEGSAVSLQMTAYATAGVEIAKRGAVQVTLPYVVQQRGYATDDRAARLEQPVDLASSALGDLRIDGRMLVAANETQTFSLAIRGAMFLPTGNEFSFTGERSAWGNLGVSAEYNAEAFFVTANAGLTVRPRSTFVDLRVGSEFVYALGAYVPLRADRVRLGAEFWGGVGLSSQDPEAIPVEGALSGRFSFGARRRVFLGLSAGGRLGVGYAPDMRFVARIGGVLPFEREYVEPRLPVRVLVPQADTDEDGFVDADDKCPATKEDNKREKDGCPETDEDKDGIDTREDQCPTEAEDKDGLDDEDGCPEEDADEDGFADIEDKCPKDPGVKNQDPAKLGCPRYIERTMTEVLFNKKIEFEIASATIRVTSYPILDEIAKVLLANPQIKQMRIEGYTDNAGDAMFNRLLSKRRAEAVRRYLVQNGKVKEGRLSAAGFGPAKPIAPNDTEDGRAKNRRVELHYGEEHDGGKEKKP